MITPSLCRAYRFFHANAGYVVGARASGALALARAERDGKRAGLLFDWEPDQCADEPGAERCCVWTWEREDYRALPISLCEIVGADAAYRRVIEAELAREALPFLAAEERAQQCASVGLSEDVPDGILADALLDADMN